MPASRKQSASRRPNHGVSLAVLSTTVLPVIKAAATGPPASANGKLYGAMTTQTPYGFITLRLCERRSEEHTSELQSRVDLVCRLLLEKKNETHSDEEHRARQECACPSGVLLWLERTGERGVRRL